MSAYEKYTMIDSDGCRIHFTEIQKECIDYGGKSVFVTKGTAGSGKSLTMIKRAMERRKKIIEQNLRSKIMIFTYNVTLSNGIKYILETNDVKRDDQILDVINVDKFLSILCYNLRLVPKKSGNHYNKGRYDSYRKKGDSINKYLEQIKEEDRINIIKEVLKELSKENDHRYFKLDPEFWADEILWMYRNGIVDHDDEQIYLRMPRSGRCKTYKVRMTQDGRKVAFRIFIEYNNRIYNKNIEWDRVYALLYRDHLGSIDGRHKYDYIFVDEAQDLTFTKMRIINELCKNELEIAMDRNQSLYGHRWKFIDCLGSVPHVKTLHMMHRGTQEIDKFSRGLKRVDDSLLDEGDRYDYELSPMSGNILPKIVKCESSSSEMNFIINEIRVLQKQNTTIAILCLNYKDLYTFESKLKEAGIDADFFRNEDFNVLKPGVKLITVYSAKGLGFGYVFVPYFQEGVYPRSIESIINSLKISEYNEDSKVTIEETIAEEVAESRRLAYVAITRAMGNVYLTYSGNPSRFIGEFDAGHYDLIDESHGKTNDSRINKIHQESPRRIIQPSGNYDSKSERGSIFERLNPFRKTERKQEHIVNTRTVSKNEQKSRVIRKRKPRFEYESDSRRGRLISLVTAKNLEYIDFGPKAPFWVLDWPGVDAHIEYFKTQGYSFNFSPNGSKGTKGRPGYYIWLKD